MYAQWTSSAEVVGKTGPAGGYVFYDDLADGTDDMPALRYLEAAPEDITNDAYFEGAGPFGGYGTLLSTLSELGTGESNSAIILNQFGDTEPYQNKGDYAARLCSDYSANGYDDWFLPSKDELVEMYDALHLQGIGGFSNDSVYGHYLCSTEVDEHFAWNLTFATGHVGHCYKYNPKQIRPARSFGVD